MHPATPATLALALLLLSGAVPALNVATPSLEPEPHAHGVLAGHAPNIEFHPDVVVGPAPAPRHVAGEEIVFRCPEGPFGLPLAPGIDTTDRTVYGCPIRVYDQGNPFGNPQIVVNDRDHREVAFCALHGAPTGPEDGTHGYSRVGQTHVFFTTADQGLTWEDQPIGSSQTPNGGLGDLPDCTVDDAGFLYGAYLWSHPLGSGENASYGATIGLYKAATARDRGGVYESYSDPYVIESRGPRNPIDKVHLITVDSFFQPYGNETAAPTPTPTGNGTGNGTTEEDFGEAAVPGQEVPQQVWALWHERGEDRVRGMDGWIDAARTDTGPRNNWTRIHNAEVIGPCLDASNPVSIDGDIYVACTVAKGYNHRGRANVGDVDVWKIDTATGKSSFVANSGVRGIHPLLAMAPDGYTILLTYRMVERGEQGVADIEVEVAQGWYGRQWGQVPGNWAGALRQASGGRTILDADVTALSVSEQDHTGVLLYKEFHPPSNEADVQRLLDEGTRLVDYTKVVVTFNSCDGPMAAAQFTTGTGIDLYQADAYAQNPEIYNDVQDGLYYTVDPATGEELWYFAVNDYGAMQYGAIDVRSAGSFCIVPVYVPSVPVPPVPQALALANPATTAIGAVVGLGVTAMAGYLLLARRKAPQTLAAEDR